MLSTLVEASAELLLNFAPSGISFSARTAPERRVLIKQISLGSQTVNNVLTGGRLDNGVSLLGMGVLKWSGRFTIDTATDRLILG